MQYMPDWNARKYEVGEGKQQIEVQRENNMNEKKLEQRSTIADQLTEEKVKQRWLSI